MYKEFPVFVFRAPLLSFHELASHMEDEEKLVAGFKDPVIEEAVYLASPVLYREMKKVVSGASVSEKEKSRILSAAGRYISRMSTRCTPFGLFAGCGMGELGEKTEVMLNGKRKRVTKLDMYYLSTLCDAIFRIPEVRRKITYYPNSSLYRLGKKYRYVESRYVNQVRKYSIVEVETSGYLQEILTVAQKGCTIQSLTDLLIDESITIAEAEKYLIQLIDSQVLIGELSQTVVGDDLLNRLIALLERIEYNGEITGYLKEIVSLLELTDDPETKTDVSVYREIENLIKKIEIPYEEHFLFQVDTLNHSSSATLSPEIIDELKSVLHFLNRITPVQRNPNLMQFTQAFYQRYEEQEVFLMEVLDPEHGLGYPLNSNTGDPSPLIDGFIFPGINRSEDIWLNSFQRLLLKKIEDSRIKGDKTILLTDEDVQGGEVSWDDLPPTLIVFFEIIYDKAGSLQIRFRSSGGGSAANLIARFGHTDKKLLSFIKEITQKEQERYPDKILAEIIHLPEARVGNVLFRPHFRDYEILYMSTSDLPMQQQICMEDLKLSIRKGELVLRSEKLDKEIIPRLTSAHNYRNSMPAYWFLCDMQHARGRLGFPLSLGSLENMFSFIPRIQYRNTILFPASWVFREKELKELLFYREDNQLIEWVDQWRKERGIPRFVVLPDNDNELFVDWESILNIRSLFSVIKKRTQVKFTEFIFDPEQAVFKSDKGSYTNECIVAFYKE